MTSFFDWLDMCAGNREFVQEFDRLFGANLSEVGSRSGLAAAIDEATGRDRENAEKFVSFVWDLWQRIPSKERR